MNPIEAVSAELASMLSTCAVHRAWAEQDLGPYHRDAEPTRRDVVEDREGVALQLGLQLVDSGSGQDGAPRGGAPVTGAVVEIWQCDALGRYSGFPPPDPSVIVTAETAPRGEYLADQTFLRGRQTTDAAGMVEFRTIYPGWYPGRTVHVHVMVHVGDVVLTSQLYFPDEISDFVLAQAPYHERPGRDTTNATDGIFSTGGEPAVLDVAPVDAGYRAGICLVLPTVGGST
jgi:protocatechuate 3,4-dioxygenase beta subunit